MTKKITIIASFIILLVAVSCASSTTKEYSVDALRTYLDEPITGKDFEFPKEFNIGDYELNVFFKESKYFSERDANESNERLSDAFLGEIDMYGDLNGTLGYGFEDHQYIQVYNGPSPMIMCEIKKYFDNNYLKICETESTTVMANTPVRFYIDPTNDARMFVWYDCHLAIFNKYRYLEAQQVRQEKRNECERKRATIANAGLIEF